MDLLDKLTQHSLQNNLQKKKNKFKNAIPENQHENWSLTDICLYIMFYTLNVNQCFQNAVFVMTTVQLLVNDVQQ